MKIVKTSPNGNVSGISFQIFKGDEAHTAGTVWKTVTTDSSGTILLEKIERGYYWIREVVPEGYAPQEDQRIWVSSSNTADNPARVTFANKPLALKIIKTSTDGNVAGITFRIYKGDTAHTMENVWKTVKTDENGVIQLEKPAVGVYWIREVVPDGYAAQEDQRIEVTSANTAGSPATVTFRNQRLCALKLIKTSPDGNVAGITFQIFTGRSAPAQDAVPLYTVTTGDDGTVLLKNLSVGIYWVREVVPEGYVPQKDRQIRVLSANTPDNPATVRFDNRLLRGSIAVNKVDFGGEPLSGATFLLEYSVDNGVTWQAVRPASADDSGIGTCVGVEDDGTITTGADGVAEFSNLIVYGVTYRLTETAAPNGYLLFAEPVFTGSLSANAEQKYELTFDVVNAPLLQMPPTGGAGNLRAVVSLATAVLLLGLLGITVALRRKKTE